MFIIKFYQIKVITVMKNYEPVKINHPNWPYSADQPYRILIISGSGSRKTNALLNLIKHQQPDIDKNLLIKVSSAY